MATYSSKKFSALLAVLVAVLAIGCRDHGQQPGPGPVGASYPFAYPVGTATGDLGGSYPAPTVKSIGGASPIPVTPSVLQFSAGTAGPTISQATQTSNVATSSITLQPQAPFASATLTNRNTQPVILNFPTPVAGGTAGFLSLQQNGVEYLRLASGEPTVNGFGSQSGFTYVVGTGIILDNSPYLDGTTALRTTNGATQYGQINSTGFQLFNTATQFGGGVGVEGMTNATTAPTTNPTAGGVRYAKGGTENWRGSGGAVTTYAGAGTGTQNSQSGVVFTDEGFLRTVSSATPTTIYSYATASATSGHFSADTVCRATTAPTAGAIGDTWSSRQAASYRNIAGTITIVGTLTAIDTDTDTSMSATAVTATSSGANLLIQVANVASATVDCQTEFHVVAN